MLYSIIRPFLFKFDPEYINKVILKKLQYIHKTRFKKLLYKTFKSKPVNCMGLNFPNALGLAAGFDKNAEYIDVLNAMGFGFIEVGTVTPKPQLGNQKPRIFRLVKAEGIINRMGFNNNGIDNLVENINKSHFKGILGINIGKNQETPIEKAKDDYLTCMKKIYTKASYIAINISSPNTPKLRMLQYGEALDDLLLAIKLKQKELQKYYVRYTPVVVKISPDLYQEEVIQIADSLIRHNIDGVIATNTTVNRTFVIGLKHAEEIGGLSGRPIQLRSTQIIQCLSKELRGQLPIIGAGGIDSLISAREKINAGATLIQIYSGLIYKGPSLISDIVCYL
ncbi:quinone-dependent dihydroorotate dehydrogenase [Candidatus Pantoea carbekii]|uniref:Dihydroorotate dehydrogenase (quinone) n=1 Tax=Candidatus Pantoea carbekii TaxID=1235990 RepID=U3U895_9GAMM|nr:quinone-dependent dihydroorotate dehydrogenase [Candidatus Pantoea carbekii]AKC32155.1 dihydroorotate dehydrogenase PyrD [Candidatus Pantoea carbekii]BAO00682.1 PyrD protein [Candidatus Pantoea carbekii]